MATLRRSTYNMSDRTLTGGQQGSRGSIAGKTSGQSDRGEVAGSFLRGLVQSFYSLSILPQGGMAQDIERVSPEAWYPYTVLVDALHNIEKTFSSSEHLFFRAGIKFLRIWYEGACPPPRAKA